MGNVSLTADDLASIVGRPMTTVMQDVVAGVVARGGAAGIWPLHRLAHYISQTAHESGGYRHVIEGWGPTAAQRRYEGRADLGNTVPGDGFKFRGRTVGQITGRANYSSFLTWCRANFRDVPDFLNDPDALLKSPWSGLAPVWFWEVRPKLLAAADSGSVRAVTRIVNGGTNGLADRERYYTRAALWLLGHHPESVRAFQGANGLTPDGIAGPLTQAALHNALVAREGARYAVARPRSIWVAIAARFRRIFGG